MIKDFWQERKAEKKRLKELKKQNKKLPKTKEQKAYKIFGVCFALFLIFGSIFYTCKGVSDIDNYSWDSLIGISEEMKSKLATPVNRADLITTKQLDTVDWSNCKDDLIGSGVGGVIIADEIDLEILTDKTITLNSTLSLDSRNLGALAKKMLAISSYGNSVELIETILTYENNELSLRSLVYLDLTAVVLGNNLPYVYVTTTSVVNILNNDMYCMNSEFVINNFSEEDNIEVMEVIDENALVDLGFYTNELIARQINTFSDGVNAIVRINNGNLEID